MGKVLIDIAGSHYQRIWGAHGTGNLDHLGDLERSSLIWRNNRGWTVRSSDVRWVLSGESKYTATLRAVRKKKLRHKWDSARMSGRYGDKAREEKLILRNVKVLKRLLAKVKSCGLKASATYTEELASVSDNTMFINGEFDDQSSFQAAAWFEHSGNDWTPQAVCVVTIEDITGHPALYPLCPEQKARTVDCGLESLRFDSPPMYAESAIAIEGTETTMPILQGAHYYQAFQFGPNLQRAVRNRMPLVLMCEQSDGCLWRSTPFDLEFANVRLSHCVLNMVTQTLEGATHSTCYLVGFGLDDRRYYTDLGRDDWVLCWNLYPEEGLGFEPSDVEDADSDANAALAGEEDDFFLDCDSEFPPLGELERLDAWMGGAAWRSGALSSQLYNALTDAQFLHLQFGIDLTTGVMTDVALMFRGTPTLDSPNEHFSYGRSLFRVVLGQPFSDGAANIVHESHLKATVCGIVCEGYREAGEQTSILNLRPLNDANIPALIHAMQINLQSDPQPPITQFALRLELTTGRWSIQASNDENLDFIVLNPTINPIPTEES
ncbi:hypothetical protein [Pseudomonas huaxiensis]|uniref:hypothetical protein n=1 Tax=Pseudomonas huaxiensis TaxID=2213017 RepID=UPI000DA6D773|nr:hypothetical protein [Pseudomonas huaxiensis]